MKPAPFRYHAPDSVAAALVLKAEHGEEARFLAGGQSLIPAMNFRLAQPAVLIDLNRIAALDHLDVAADGSIRIGAMARYRRIERDPEVTRQQPLLREALAEVAHPQIRSRGTLGGNLAHADPASEMPAVMLALDARLRAVSVSGERWIDAAQFFLGTMTTALRADELLAEIQVPALAPRSGTCFLELARRRGDYPMMGIAAVVTLEPDGTCRTARLTCCNAGDTPIIAVAAAASLVGLRIGDAALRQAAGLVRHAVSPSGNVQASAAYQRHLASVLTGRALRIAAARAA